MIKKKYIIAVVVIVLVISIIAVITVLTKPKVEYSNLECIKKGNVCTSEEIKTGILIPVAVNKSKIYDFYMISNTEDSMTLIMNKNLVENVNWHEELANIKGPMNALSILQEKTDNWTEIKPIDNYEYEDYGKKYFEIRCKNDQNDNNYDCSTERYDARGYDTILFNKDVVKITSTFIDEGEALTFKLDSGNFRARLITAEEALILDGAEFLASNLDDKAYWTMSSATSANVQYMNGAYAIQSIDGSPSIEAIFVKQEINNLSVGIRPVITVSKR